MSAPPPFAGVDPVALEHVTMTIGMAFAAASAETAPSLINDDTVPPEALIAGIVRAHLLGAASLIASRPGAFDPRNPLITDAITFLAETLRDMRLATQAPRA